MGMKITVFTPTFNRGYVIGKLYNSLKQQIYSNFEWVIIDNGTDCTENLVNEFRKENILEIKYKKDLNRIGINRAYNDALKIATGELFFKVDDDDYLSNDALLILNNLASVIDSSKIAAVSGLRVFPNGDVNGGKWKHKGNYIDASNFQREKLGLGGDKAEAYFTSILRKYGPLPEIENEKYTDEGLLYYRIANDGYQIRWTNSKIYYSDYLEDGVTKNWENVICKNPNTYKRNMVEYLNMKNMPFSIKFKKMTRYFYIFRKHNFSRKWILSEIPGNSFIKSFCWIISYMYIFTNKK